MEMMMKKRILYYPLLILALCLALFGCTKDPSNEETKAPSEPAATTQPTQPPVTEPINPVVDDGDTTEYALYSEDVYMGLVNARNDIIPLSEDWGYGDSSQQVNLVVIATQGIRSMGIYTADGTPVYACGYTLYYEQADGTRKAVGTVYAGEEGSNLYVLHNGDYRVTRIDAADEHSWIRVCYDRWNSKDFCTRGMEYDHLSYDHKITVHQKTGLMTNVDGISINNGKPSVETTFVNEYPVDWDSLSWERYTPDAYAGLSNAGYLFYLEANRKHSNLLAPIRITTCSIQSIALYTAEGYPIYAFDGVLFYDDADGTPHVTGRHLYSSIRRDYLLYDGNYTVGRISSLAPDAWIAVSYRSTNTILRSLRYDQKLLLSAREESASVEEILSVADADPAEFTIISDAVYQGLLNARQIIPDTYEETLEERIAIHTNGIESICLYTKEGYPIYAIDDRLYYDDAAGEAHRVGRVDYPIPSDISRPSYAPTFPRYFLLNGEYRIGNIRATDPDARIAIDYMNIVNPDHMIDFRDLDQNAKFTIREWVYPMGTADGITRDDQAPFTCEILSKDVYKGLGNAPVKAMEESAGERTLDSIEIDTTNVTLNLYTADGYPIYAFSGKLYYEDSDGVKHKAGFYDYAENSTVNTTLYQGHYHLYSGEYYLGWVKTTIGDPSIKISYNLDEAWSASDPAVTLQNPKKNDRIFIHRWQPGMTNEDGILIQRG